MHHSRSNACYVSGSLFHKVEIHVSQLKPCLISWSPEVTLSLLHGLVLVGDISVDYDCPVSDDEVVPVQ